MEGELFILLLQGPSHWLSSQPEVAGKADEHPGGSLPCLLQSLCAVNTTPCSVHKLPAFSALHPQLSQPLGCRRSNGSDDTAPAGT